MTPDNNILPFDSTHPGALIKDELEARPELKQKDLAKELGVKASFLNEIIKGKRPVTADLAILLEKILEIPADYWMKFQSQYEIDKARIKAKNINRIKNIETWKVTKENVPVKYFKKLGYLNDNLEKDIPAINEIYGVDSVNELVAKYNKSKPAFYRKSTKLQIDEKNIFAWSSLAIHEANKLKVNAFDFETLNQLYSELNIIFYHNSDTIEKVKSTLKQFGVKLVLIPKPEKAPIDGFTFWSGNNPTIALTIRHNRLDNFAFTLIHELAHIELHLKNNKDSNFLDLIHKNPSDKSEKQADLFAQEKLIPKSCWNDLVSNYLPLNDYKLIELGEKYNINPAIILDRICREMNYSVARSGIEKTLK